jgi:hypothetical protein
LIIGYYDNSQDIFDFESGELTTRMTIRFTPYGEMTQKLCLEYTNQNIQEIIKEAKTIISQHNDFYKNFEIDSILNFRAICYIQIKIYLWSSEVSYI